MQKKSKIAFTTSFPGFSPTRPTERERERAEGVLKVSQLVMHCSSPRSWGGMSHGKTKTAVRCALIGQNHFGGNIGDNVRGTQ